MTYVLRSALISVPLVFCMACNKIDFTPKKNRIESNGFYAFTIRQDHHYCDDNIFTEIETMELKFSVVFDSSAIYQTAAPENQKDINKLLGFSDNESQHHLFSARFGWRWSNDSLRLFSYVYNNAELIYEEIGTLQIGIEYNCSILVTDNSYKFILNDKEIIMPRASTTPMAKGFKLYPYFGGDERAPHDIRIWIKE
jgi:hypothetical protein